MASTIKVSMADLKVAKAPDSLTTDRKSVV